jgi:hypothetical protein
MLPRTEISSSATSTRHHAQLCTYLGLFIHLHGRTLQQYYKRNTNSKGWLKQSSQLADKKLPYQSDLLGASEPISVHVAVSVRIGTISHQPDFQNISKVVCTHIYIPHTSSPYHRCCNLDICTSEVVILHIAFESTERKTLLEYLGCTFQGS